METFYKQIPQYQYLINNIPAGKYGEWPGIKSNHWKGSIRIIKPIRKTKIFDDGGSPIEKNRRHYKEKFGFEKPYKPEKRLYSAYNFKYEDKKEGLKAINFRPAPVKTAFDRRHYPEKIGVERIPFFKGLRTFYPNGQCRTFNEFSLERQMGGKKRIWTIEQKRNGIEFRIPGDKYYKASEQFPTYYKEGGLIPGSTIATNFNKTRSKTSYNFYETMDLTKPTLNKNKIWENKLKNENLYFDKKYVEQYISSWEKNILNDFDPNYSKKKNEPEAEPEPEQEELTPEIEELINRGYVPLDVYTPETQGHRSEPPFAQIEPVTSKPGTVETFSELPKFLQDRIKSITAGNYSTKYLTDTYYSRGHFREVRATYLAMVSRFNNDNTAMTNAERAERCFAMARYVYNFFALADESDKRQYPASEEDNIRIMAYKGLEYLIYSQLDGASRNEANYDTARRYCLLKLTDEIQEARRIDENNAWLRIYIYSYFVNGLRFHSSSGKWSAQNVTLSGCSLLEFNDFGKFFEGLLTLAYVAGAELVMPTLKALLHSLEYSGSLLGKLGLDESVYSQDNVNKEIISSFQKTLDDWGKRSNIMIQDAEVKLSPELLRILSVQKSIVSLMKRELTRILGATPENLDEALKRANPILASEEYSASLAKTRRKYDPDAGLLDVLPINVLGAVMRQYWNDCFGAYFGGKPYSAYWKERFAKLQWVRDPVFHAHPEYIKDEDIEEARAVCIEIAECLRGKNLE